MVNFFYSPKIGNFNQYLLYIVYFFNVATITDTLQTLIFLNVNINISLARQKLPTINVLFT